VNRGFVSFLVGIIFSLGLGVSGMTQPQNVIGFLDIQHWNPALLFVMIGAVTVHGLAFQLIRRLKSPLLDTKWHLPTRDDITLRLIVGSAVFGIGWGLTGYCPGPALTSMVSGDPHTFIFVGTMVIGMMLFVKTERFLALKE
jgi:uncharacterized protein